MFCKTGLVLQIFELGKIFAQKKMVRFYPEGTCMYPCIRPGDILHIEPKDAGQIKIGDIAVYRRNNRLFAHRAIDKGHNNGSNYIITRPDTAGYGNDGPTSDEDILGIVSGIERKGKILSPEKRDYNLADKIGLEVLLKRHYFKQYLFGKIIFAIIHVQQYKIYRKIAKLLFHIPNRKIDFSLQVPLNFKMQDGFQRKISAQELTSINLKAFPKWMLMLNINSKPVASLSFSGRDKFDTNVRIRYRGTGIEEKLFKKADELLIKKYE